MPLSIEQRPVPLSTIRPGSILTVNYTKKDGSGGIYLIMVVDPYRKNQHAKEPQVHGYLVNEMTESEFINFVVALSCPILVDPINSEIKIADLSNTEAYQSLPIISTYTPRPYRTFNISGINNVTEAVITIPDELDKLVRKPLYITDRNSKRRVLQALYEGNLEALKQVPEIQNVLREVGGEELQQEEAAEREIQQSRPTVSLRQYFNSAFKRLTGK